MLRNNPLPQTRREFLATGIKGLSLVAAGSYLPSFVAHTAYASPASKDTPILVVIQLSGGNDGLNTIIPFADDEYYKARPNIGIAAKDALKLDDSFAIHSAMSEVKGLFDEGQATIVQGVGYPNPDRSHFRSMEIWHTGKTSDSVGGFNGWLGRYFDAECNGRDPLRSKVTDYSDIGLSFGKTMPQAFRNSSNVGIALNDPDTFRWNPSGETTGLVRAQEEIFAKINRPGSQKSGSGLMRRSMANIGGISGNEPETLEFLRHTAMNAVVAGDTIRDILQTSKDQVPYPNTGLASQLQMIGNLIGGDFPTRVYYARQGGYDTHAKQAYTHTRLLSDFSQSVAAFTEQMKKQKNSQKVIVMAFSEFGRRVAENGSEGTDHGAAAPMFLFGEPLQGGLVGDHPSLTDLNKGDLKHNIDFRSVYSSLLKQWLKTDPNSILGKNYPTVGLV